MKKLYVLVLLLLISLHSFTQTASTTITFTGAQALGCCNVCGLDYWCINNTGGCGQPSNTITRTFADPVPAGYIVDHIQVNYYSAQCSGGSLSATIDGNAVPLVNEGSTGCFCSTNPCGVSAATSVSYPCGMPGYVYGGTNTFVLTTGVDVCMQHVTLVITYVTPATINPSITASGSLNFCQGGSVVLDAGAGYSAYNWSNGLHTQTITVSTSGTYVVTVTSVTGCTTGSASQTVNVYPNPSSSISSSSNVKCNGGNTGSATVTPSGGTPGYTYSWSPSGGNAATANNLTSGPYVVTVTDSHGCTTTSNVTLTQPATALSNATSSTPAGCSVSNGTATASPSGGTPGYTYNWTPSGQTTPIATGLAAGIYSVTVTDANGCTKINSVTVTGTSSPSVTATSTQAGCTVANGTATANPSGGTGGYTYSWTPSGQTTIIATGLAAGTYSILLTDANGCTKTNSVTITATGTPNVTATSTQAGCTVANGTATANPSGGTGAYTYSWSPSNQTTITATGIATGTTYTVLLTDANGCSKTNTVSITSTSSPSATASSTQATCSMANGTATVTPTGGTPGYSYSWSPGGQTTQIATGISTGTYSVLVTDANGCTATSSVSIVAANGPTVTATVASNVSCNGGNDGSATTSLSGGTPNYTYLWSNGQTTTTATGLSSGAFSVTVTDANQCSFIATGSVSQPSALTNTVSSTTNVSCFGNNSGTTTVTTSGGTPPYTYFWSNGQTTSTATGLAAGNYTVTATDNLGCTQTTTIAITQPVSALTNTVSSTVNVSCFGNNSGTATATVIGGTSPYIYFWSNGQTTSTATGLVAGNYTVTATDNLGCTQTATIVITQPTSALTNTISSTISVACYGNNTGSATALISGGTSPYTYLWSNGQTTSTATGLGAATYTVTAIDNLGCTQTATISITQPTAALLNTVSSLTNVSCFGGNNGSATANPTGGTPIYTFGWFPTGGNTQTENNLTAGTYTVIVKDANGCLNTTTVTITQPTMLSYTASANDSICKGYSTVLTTNVIGGTPAYTYVWNPNASSNPSITVSPTSATNYSVSIADANGCAAGTHVFNIYVLPVPNALFDTASAGTFASTYSFSDLSTPSVTITAWNWNFGDGDTSSQQNPVHTFSGAGTYTVTEIAFNKFGCPDTFKIMININEGILIPNVFTPDGDGVNDVWYIPNSGMKEFNVQIFDRWGAKVFETSADEIRWDGHSSSGKLLSDGTYYFVLKAVLKTGTGGKNYSTSGYVTLLTKKTQ